MYSAVIHIRSGMLADFFRYIFPPSLETGECAVTASHPVGALMIAFAEPSLLPAKSDEQDAIMVDIPRYDNATTSISNHYVYFNKEAEARIRLALNACFEMDFQGYYRKGEELGMMKKDIVDAYIFSRHLEPDIYSALHKRVYRKQQRAQEAIRRKLLRKAYYFNESIDYSGLDFSNDKV